MQMMVSGQNSYWAWAYSLSSLQGFKISKQAIFYRMNDAWIATIKSLLAGVIVKQSCRNIKSGLFKAFGNVWIHDSTCVQLPQALIKKFPGSVVNGKQNSVAKLSLIMNVLNGHCPFMEWNSYVQTEQSLSATILQVAKKGDLVIRDLGYFVLRIFAQMDKAEIFYLSRWKYGVNLYDVHTRETIHLAQRLKGKSYLDVEALCGRDEKLNVRLVIIKLPPEQTEQRIRKAKKQNKGRTSHGNDYYALLKYIVLITNVKASVWNYKQVAEAYRSRWNIEILFKGWKTGLNIKSLIPQEQKLTRRTESILYLMLLYISWFQQLIYVPLRLYCLKNGQSLSIIQCAKWMNINLIHTLLGYERGMLQKEIITFCCYGKRRKLNAEQRLFLSSENLLT
jgi:hypothetical protein